MLLWIIVSGLIITGCKTTSPNIAPATVEPWHPSVKSKIPLHVGLYLTPQFKQFTFKGGKGGIHDPFTISIGDTMCSYAESSLKELFLDVSIINDLEQDPKINHVDVIIMPEIIDIDSIVDTWKPDYWKSNVTCKWSIKNINGIYLYLNTIVGINYYRPKFGFTNNDNDSVKEGVILAIQNHYQRLIDDIIQINWWHNIK